MNRIHYMLDFDWEIIDSIKKKTQGLLQKIVLAPFFLLNSLVTDTKMENVAEIIC